MRRANWRGCNGDCGSATIPAKDSRNTDSKFSATIMSDSPSASSIVGIKRRAEALERKPIPNSWPIRIANELTSVPATG